MGTVRKNLIGMTFSNFLVVERDLSKFKTIYKCLCSCNNITYVDGRDLSSGHTKSCGHLRKNKFTDLTGLRFERLIVLNREPDIIKKDLHKTAWKCQCDCGEIVIISSNQLKTGNNSIIFKYSGLDRVDNLSNHNKNNIVPAYKFCNYAKSDLSLEEFQIWIKRITEYQKNKKEGSYDPSL